MASIFVLEELPNLGGFRPRTGVGVKFEWTAAQRNIPLQPWTFGGQQRTTRTDYPGTDRPTEQVMGPNFTPFTLNGKWMNKFNAVQDGSEGGYAVATWKAFEQMCNRGNPVSIAFQDVDIIGIITSWSFNYLREDHIEYSFTVSPHRRASANNEILQAPEIVKTITDHVNDVNVALASLEVFADPNLAAGEAISGTTLRDVQQGITDTGVSVASFQSSVEQRILDTDLGDGVDINRAISALDSAIAKAAETKTQTQSLRADTDLAYKTATNVLSFETWSRGTAASARQMIFDSHQVRKELDKRASADAIAFYRPSKGESLYGISNRFYGTPHNARLIAERNGIKDMVLEGTELLVIPEKDV